MSPSKVKREIARLVEAIDDALERWYNALEESADALIEASVQDQLHALRGWSEEAASEYDWTLEFVQTEV